MEIFVGHKNLCQIDSQLFKRLEFKNDDLTFFNYLCLLNDDISTR